ncbi:MAG: hypothetical protein Q9181_001225 [Wetmoreana brouardii]
MSPANLPSICLKKYSRRDLLRYSPPVEMPSLILPQDSPTHHAEENAGSESPTAPPFSPITPVMSNSLPSHDSKGWQQASPVQAPPIPPLQTFSESDNPDAIALRSAISVLQIQRQQSLRDLISLERQKKIAATDPEGFATAVTAGKIKTHSTGVLGSTPGFTPSAPPRLGNSNDAETESDIEACAEPRASIFEDIPGPQNVVRCPPINWAKYHVLGEPLDKLHEEQRRRPVNDQTLDDESQTRGEENIVAAPFDPWRDKLEPLPQKADHSRDGSHETG